MEREAEPVKDAAARPLPRRGAQRNPTLRAVLAYQACDAGSGWLILFMVVFSPWAFGTTQPWAIWTMNATGYALGFLFFCKWFIRFRHGHTPPRWGDDKAGQLQIRSLAALTVGILAFCLVAAINARSTYNAAQMDFSYRHHLGWLPHSYDRDRTWQAFANYLALAFFFWAARDWLLGKTANESRAAPTTSGFRLPERLRQLLWVLTLNGALLAIEGIAQRLSGTNKLLWFMPTRINAEAEYQFGPYAYRANAAQYFNLLWPVALAFWWLLRREKIPRLDVSSPRRIVFRLLPPIAVMLMAACPIMTLSRGGALVSFGSMAVAMVILLGLRRQSTLMKLGIVLFFGTAAGGGLWLASDKLGERMKLAGEGLRNREATYETARQIAREFPLYGTGPGTFEPVFQAYRSSLDEYWPRQLHNDWLETRITFGWVGTSMIGLAFLLAVTRWFGRRAILIGWRFVSLFWLALCGCLIHALYDFPFQIYSVLLMFLLLCAVLSTLSWRKRREA